MLLLSRFCLRFRNGYIYTYHFCINNGNYLTFSQLAAILCAFAISVDHDKPAYMYLCCLVRTYTVRYSISYICISQLLPLWLIKGQSPNWNMDTFFLGVSWLKKSQINSFLLYFCRFDYVNYLSWRSPSYCWHALCALLLHGQTSVVDPGQALVLKIYWARQKRLRDFWAR